MTKIPKKAQVAFNQFIFDSMMDKYREAELQIKEVQALSKQVSTHINDHRVYSGVIEKRFVELENGRKTHSIEKRSRMGLNLISTRNELTR